MYSELNTCVLEGLKGHIVSVETDINKGMPVFNIVGLPDISVKEAKERVRSAIKNSKYDFPLSRITVNLVPADLKKIGTQFDLPIAIGILRSTKYLKNKNLKKYAFIGELSLDGSINKIKGILPMIISLKKQGIENCFVPFDSRYEAGVVGGINILPVKTLKEVIDHINDKNKIKTFKEPDTQDTKEIFNIDFKDIKGQENLKRAMEVAAAGGHNMLILGPPGSGKTMAAKRLPTIMPNLSLDESLEVTKIYSISGLLKDNNLIKQRPFRSPHHTASTNSIVGGGRNPKPGEVSLSHNGILFLDELPEFKKSCIEVLRQPMEDGFINISRVNSSVQYPAKFMLIASMNPCQCGYYGDPYHECSCSQSSIDRYLGKISNPLLDRIDIHIEVKPVNYKELSSSMKMESSEEIKNRVIESRKIQYERYKNSQVYNNAQLNNKLIKEFCTLTKEAKSIMEVAFNKYKFSARSYDKILKISRTIADLDGHSDNINTDHVLEAIRYRTLDNKYF